MDRFDDRAYDVFRLKRLLNRFQPNDETAPTTTTTTTADAPTNSAKASKVEKRKRSRPSGHGVGANAKLFVFNASPCRAPLRIGDLGGNYFEITVRNISDVNGGKLDNAAVRRELTARANIIKVGLLKQQRLQTCLQS